MKYTLYINLSDPSSIYREAECNKGIDQVPALLDEIRRRGEVVGSGDNTSRRPLGVGGGDGVVYDRSAVRKRRRWGE